MDTEQTNPIPVVLQVKQTWRRRAFDIIQGDPGYNIRHSASAVKVKFGNLCEEGRRRTYANDKRPFGPTIRHKKNISKNFIDKLKIPVGKRIDCELSILDDGTHLYEIKNIE